MLHERRTGVARHPDLEKGHPWSDWSSSMSMPGLGSPAAAAFPKLAVEVCAVPERLPALLAAFQPTLAYSCKTGGMPGPAHRPLLDCPSLTWLHVGGSGYDHLAGWETRAIRLEQQPRRAGPLSWPRQ